MIFLPTILLLTSVVQQEPTYSHVRMPAFGTIYRDKLFGLFEIKEPHRYCLHSIELKGMKANEQTKYYLLWHAGIYHRNRIRFDRIWLSEGFAAVKSMSLEDVMRFDLRGGVQASDEYFNRYLSAGSKRSPDMISLPALRKGERERILLYNDMTAQELAGLAALGYVIDPLAGFGIVPTSRDTCKTFFLSKKRGYLEIWDTQARFDKKKMEWKTIADEQNYEKLKSEFSEDFYVFIQKDTYYFVTESGKLYYAPPPKATEKSRTMQELWWDAKRPIVALIEDADRDKIWLFAQDKKRVGTYDLFFEMKETVRYELFDPAKLGPVNIEGRAKLLLQYVPLILPTAKK